MDRREEFLHEQAVAWDEYVFARDRVRRMMSSGLAKGDIWTRQTKLLNLAIDRWSALPRQYLL